jgi:hypothetical protein
MCSSRGVTRHSVFHQIPSVTRKGNVAAKGNRAKSPRKQLRDDSGRVDPTIALQFHRTAEIWKTVRTGFICVCVVGSILAVAPVAHQIAGQNTNVNVNIAVALSLTLVLTNGGSLWWGYQRHRAAKYNRDRANNLEGERDAALDRVRELEQGVERRGDAD